MAFESKCAAFVLFLVLAGLLPVHAQFSVPPFDVEVKGSFFVFGRDNHGGSNIGEIHRIQSFNVHAAAHWQLNQYVGIGWFYCKSVKGSIFTENANGGEVETGDALMMMTGPDVRLSTGRGKKWRPYLSLNYCKIELINDKVDYRLASTTKAYGGSLGIMLRLSNKVYLNLVEVGARVMSEKPFWYTNSEKFFLEAKTGVTVNFGKRK